MNLPSEFNKMTPEDLSQHLLHEVAAMPDYCDVPKAVALIHKGAGVNAADKEGVTVLMWALRHKHIEIVRLLVAKGADINAATPAGNTALIEVAHGGYKEVIHELIDKGADINAANKIGNTALMFAACAGHKEVAGALVAAGADIAATNWDKKTALDEAEARKYPEIAQILRNSSEIQKLLPTEKEKTTAGAKSAPNPTEMRLEKLKKNPPPKSPFKK